MRVSGSHVPRFTIQFTSELLWSPPGIAAEKPEVVWLGFVFLHQFLCVLKRRPLDVLHNRFAHFLHIGVVERMKACDIRKDGFEALDVSSEPHAPPDARIGVVIEISIGRLVQYDTFGELAFIVIQNQNDSLVKVLLSQPKAKVLLHAAQNDSALLNHLS